MGSGFLSPWHIAIIVLVLLLVFGAKRLPELGRGLGHGMREFKDAVTGNSSHDDALPAGTETQQPVAAAPQAPAPPAASPPPPSAQPPAEPPQATPTAASTD
jgi:sec-independent protein translocase protein TatA